MWPIRGIDILHALILHMVYVTWCVSIPHIAPLIHIVLSPPIDVNSNVCVLRTQSIYPVCIMATHKPAQCVIHTCPHLQLLKPCRCQLCTYMILIVCANPAYTVILADTLCVIPTYIGYYPTCINPAQTLYYSVSVDPAHRCAQLWCVIPTQASLQYRLNSLHVYIPHKADGQLMCYSCTHGHDYCLCIDPAYSPQHM